MSVRIVHCLVILIFLQGAGIAQLTDNFNEDRLNPVWQGDRGEFMIEDGALRLNAPSQTGNSRLYTAINTESNYEWRFDFKLDFNPSNSNRLDIMLYADDTDLLIANGYLLRIGETGSDDALQFIKLQNGEETILQTGVAGNVGSKPQGSIIVTRDSLFNWEVSARYRNGFTEAYSILDSDVAMDIDGFFGWTCKYTSTRSDKFYFDNIYMGSPFIDLTPPELTSISFSNQSIDLQFSEPIQTDVLGVENFIFTPDYSIIGVEVLSDVELRLLGDKDFEEGITYTLEILNIIDIASNVLDTSLTFSRPYRPMEGDLLVNEILFNPIGSGSDFVEIINTSDRYIDFNTIYIENTANGQSRSILSPATILPGEILAFCESKTNIVDTYPEHAESQIYEQDLPSFNNDDGNVSIVYKLDGEETIIDAFDYDEKYHLILLDDEDGVSLERKSIKVRSDEISNWASASSQAGYATPGIINSTKNDDEDVPLVLDVTNKVFSPNSVNQDDHAEIRYEGGSSFVANASVYDLYGKEVRRLWRSVTTASTGTLTWDGKDENDIVQPVGIYVVVMELFNLNGKVHRFKEEVVIGDN